MTQEQFENFINAMMMGSDEKETIQKITKERTATLKITTPYDEIEDLFKRESDEE